MSDVDWVVWVVWGEELDVEVSRVGVDGLEDHQYRDLGIEGMIWGTLGDGLRRLTFHTIWRGP